MECWWSPESIWEACIWRRREFVKKGALVYIVATKTFFFFYLQYCNLSFMLLLKECCSLKMQSLFEVCEDYWSLLSLVGFLVRLLEAALPNSCQTISFLWVYLGSSFSYMNSLEAGRTIRKFSCFSNTVSSFICMTLVFIFETFCEPLSSFWTRLVL